jgi:glycosyltransferase involved in cell wall biosynthesis
MNKRLNLTLIFPKLKNVDLLKDMGLIPYLLDKNHNFNSTITCYKNETDYSYLNKEVKGQEVDFIPKNPFSTYWYIFKNYKKIDILMLVHIGSSTIYMTLLYKLLKPNGYVYMKGDMDTFNYPSKKTNLSFTKWKRAFLYKKFTQKVDLLSYENHYTYQFLNDIPSSKKLHIPNGFWSNIPKMLHIELLPVEKKEKIIFFPARHGSYQKNSELLLKAIENIDLKEWKIVFAGDMTPEFIITKDKLLKTQPHLQDSLLFLGNIVDKKEYYQWFNRATFTLLPSRWEGFPLVSLEGLYFQNILLLSDTIMSAKDLTKNNTIGFTFEGENPTALKELLLKVVNNEINIEEEQKKSLEYFNANYRWEDLAQKISDKINIDLKER